MNFTSMIILLGVIVLIIGLPDILIRWETHPKIKSFFSLINPFKKKKVTSESEEEAKTFTVPESGNYIFEVSTIDSTSYDDPKIQEQLDSIQKQINVLSADLYRLEEAEYEHHVDFFKELNRLSEAVSSKKKPTKKKVIKKKYDDHKVHTKAYKNATKAKK